MSPNLIVKGNIREVAQGFSVAGDITEALNVEVEKLIKKACERAKANGRSTVMGRDV